MNKQLNKHNSWVVGKFYNSPRYNHMPSEWHKEQEIREKRFVRFAPGELVICEAVDQGFAEWIVERLNLCAELQEENNLLREQLLLNK